jgi:tRNA threonylcarbamoyladenosine biosynthesis protein TsaE
MEKYIEGYKKYTTTNYKQTQKLGEKFAKESHKLADKITGGKTALVIALSGNLGSGKTTFLQGFAKGLGVKEKILSPTFVIMKRFSAQGGPVSGWKNFYHIDCYRLKDSKDILELDFKKLVLNPENIIAIEWPEKIGEVLPQKTITINFKFVDKYKREIIFKM